MSPRDLHPEELFPDLVSGGEAVGEQLEPSPELRARLLASVAPETRFAGYEARLSQLFDLPVERVRELTAAIARVAGAPWDDDVVPGVRLLHFTGGERCAAAHCGIVHLAPGVRYPRHRHEQREWTFVLSGIAEEEGTGRRLLPGDLDEQPPGSDHAFRAVGSEPFVFAVVLFGGIAFV
jgi:quercetin dioxygenase-like cupin family protein